MFRVGVQAVGFYGLGFRVTRARRARLTGFGLGFRVCG